MWESLLCDMDVRTVQVSAERPTLISSATQANFMAWEKLWKDFAHSQHLSLQDRETRVAALRQCLDEDLRRFIRQGTIAIPDHPDVQDIIDGVKSNHAWLMLRTLQLRTGWAQASLTELPEEATRPRSYLR